MTERGALLEDDDSQSFTLASKQDYMKVGFAAARWARETIRNARLREGGDSARLTLHVEFFSEPEPTPQPERKRGKAAKRSRKRGRGKKADAALPIGGNEE
jgi:hypothetical protein